MNCEAFRKKLNDFIEDNVSYDMEKAIEEHLKDCEQCKRLYDEELMIDKAFKETFNVNSINFSSSRVDIMSAIDKNRYRKSPIKKVYFHFKRHSVSYTSCAAIIAFLIIVTPYALQKTKKIDTSSSSPKNFATQSIEEKKENVSLRKSDISAQNVNGTAKTNLKIGDIYKPNFKRHTWDSKVDALPQPSTPWKTSPGKSLSVCLDGKGPEDIEEGVGTIYVKDLKSEDMWIMAYTNNEYNEYKYTPKFLEWWDDENIVVVIGYAYGTASHGGGLYLLNVVNSNIQPIYCPPGDNRIQVVKAKRQGTKLQMDILIYDDDKIKSYNEQKLYTGDMENIVNMNKKNPESQLAPSK